MATSISSTLRDRISQPDMSGLPEWQVAERLNAPDASLPTVVTWSSAPLRIGHVLAALGPDAGAPGARYAATFGRFDTMSKPIARTFSRSYGANAHMAPGCTGEPWNAPA